MKHLRMIAVVLLLCMMIPFSATATEARASLYLSSYLAIISEGDNSGEIVVSYSVDATDNMSEVGVKRITLYRTDGHESITIYGTTKNGLVEASTYETAGDYYFKDLTSGSYYYAVVTVYAKDVSGSDSRVITTKTIQAH